MHETIARILPCIASAPADADDQAPRTAKSPSTAPASRCRRARRSAGTTVSGRFLSCYSLIVPPFPPPVIVPPAGFYYAKSPLVAAYPTFPPAWVGFWRAWRTVVFQRASLSDTWHVMRSVCLFLMAIAVIAAAITIKGEAFSSIELGAIVVLLGGLVAVRVYGEIRTLKGHSAELRRSAVEAERHYIAVLRRVIHLVEAKDKYSRGHSERVGELAEKISLHMGLPEEQCRLMNLAGELHDIGMLSVPERIVDQHRRLGASEFRIVKRHPQAGYEVLKPLESLEKILPAIRYHHERMNGTGYPSGLSCDMIPLTARILAVADSYEAMTHDRPHRSAMSPLTAMHELLRCCPAGYDRQCVDALAQIVHLPALEGAMTCVP